MDLPADLAFRDRALLLEDTLIVADLHLGKGTSGGFELPVGDGADMLDRFRDLLAATDPARVVVAGDLLHSFRTVPRTVEDTLDGLRTAARAADADLVVTPGNHDTMLDAVWDGPTRELVRVGDSVVCHGHELPDLDAADVDGAAIERFVVGHDHPTIDIEGQRRPCFLLARGIDPATGTAGADRTPDGDTPELVMLPAFNRLLRGVAVNDIEAADLQSPLCRSADALVPVVRDEHRDETLRFPPLGQFRHRL